MALAADQAKRGGILGPRPQPLSLSSPAARPSKRPRVNGGGDDVTSSSSGLVIVYEHTPKVVHARPDEFKALVQRLTGRQQPLSVTEPPATTTAAGPPEEETATDDPLVLTLGQQAPPAAPSSSPGGGVAAAAGFLLSPGAFLFSPSTMQAIQELIS